MPITKIQFQKITGNLPSFEPNLAYHSRYLFFQFLKQQQNMGIMYEYTIPVKSKHKSRTVTNSGIPAKPQVLLTADDKLPADQTQSDTPVQNIDISPELRERYRRRYGKDIADYLFSGSRQDAATRQQNELRQGQTQSHEARSRGRSTTTQYSQQHSQRQSVTEKPKVLLLYRNQGTKSRHVQNPNSSVNPTTGHHIRHRHHRRRVITEKQPPQYIPNTVDTNLYPYQAHKLNTHRQQAQRQQVQRQQVSQSVLPLYRTQGQGGGQTVQYPPGYDYQAQGGRQPSIVLQQGSAQYPQ